MASLIDTPLDVGNPDRVVAELTANINDQRSRGADTRQKTTQDDNSDPRFRGKSKEDVIEMYRNAESHMGRLANEVGQLRRTTDQILLDKRATDLKQNGTVAKELKPTDLLERPTEALDDFFASRASAVLEPLQNRINSLENELASTRLNSTHTDAVSIANSGEFQEWVKESPLRQQVAQLAGNGNIRATQDLLTEYKLSKKNSNLEAALKAVEGATLESGRTGSDSGGGSRSTGKTYRSSDLIALRMRDPDRYEDPVFSAEILKAYQEGRVIR